jgi:hypothetical protein
MNAIKMIRAGSQLYMGFCILSLGYIAILSMWNPQATMNLVSTPLPNTDAISSIRGIYGGVGIVVTITLIYLLIHDLQKGLLFLALFWSSYALSRIITIQVDGILGSFGTQWLYMETTFAILAFLLLIMQRKNHKKILN